MSHQPKKSSNSTASPYVFVCAKYGKDTVSIEGIGIGYFALSHPTIPLLKIDYIMI